MCVYMHSHFVENHSIRILEDGPLISEVVLSQPCLGVVSIGQVTPEPGSSSSDAI
jgi:hypothetical protein